MQTQARRAIVVFALYLLVMTVGGWFLWYRYRRPLQRAAEKAQPLPSPRDQGQNADGDTDNPNGELPPTPPLNPAEIKSPELPPPLGSNSAGYVGTAACAECHRERHDGFVKTSHFRTSLPVNEKNIMGSFEANKNILRTRVPAIWFEMDQGPGGFYQSTVAVIRGKPQRMAIERFDIVIGSGKLGQSFLYWQKIDDHFELYQLPVSYLTESNEWVNSPGFRDGLASYDRPILGRCLECHVTYIEGPPDARNIYYPQSLVLGISCERCHGPGQDHVRYHQNHRADREGQHILNPRRFDRLRRSELCAQCHGGTGVPKKPSFTFRPGEAIQDYVDLEDDPKATRFQVHSNNQLPRLMQSRCYQGNDTLTCASCHNPHMLERGNLALFSQRCQNCHAPKDCGQFTSLGAAINNNCIDCHMPRRVDVSTSFDTSSERRTTPVEMREHFISIYPEDTARFRDALESAKKP